MSKNDFSPQKKRKLIDNNDYELFEILMNVEKKIEGPS